MTPSAYFQKQSWKTGPHARSTRRRFAIAAACAATAAAAATSQAYVQCSEIRYKGASLLYTHLLIDEINEGR